jgi:hypothetical protein
VHRLRLTPVTGPAPGQRMRAWLAWTGAGELASIVVFSVLAWRFTQGRVMAWPFTLFGLVLLDLVLIQGAAYWLVKRQRAGRGWPARSRLALIRALYAANVLALASFPLAVVVAFALAPWWVRVPDVLAGMALFLFACGEFMHYFLFKINMRPREWRAARRHGRPIPARFFRELRRAEAQVGGRQ